MSAVLSLQGLTVALPRGADRPEALRQVSLDLNAGEILCVVGESGSGKSMMASAIMRLLPGNVRIAGGSILFEGRDLTQVDEAAMRALRAKVETEAENVGRRFADELDFVFADLDGIAVVQLLFLGGLAIDIGAVRAVEVFQDAAVGGGYDLAMVPAHVLALDLQIVV